MGTKIALPETFSASTGKVLRKDAILPAAGVLFLIDGTHSLGGFGAGVPANGASIPNIAWDQAAAMIGSGTEATLALVVTNNLQAADGAAERTPKGGLHVAMRQDTNTNNNRGFFIGSPSLISNYILAHQDHDFYLSQWSRLTRVALTGGNRKAAIGYGGAYSAMIEYNQATAATPLGSRVPSPFNAVGNHFYNVASSAWSGTAAINEQQAGVGAFIAGNVREGASAWNNKGSSDVFYRAFLEDLTVSGRTYAEVDELDYAIWQSAFASTGRIYGDTFTAPATLAGA